MNIYFRNVNNLTAARFGAATNLFALGYNCNPQHEKYIGFEQIALINDWVQGIRTVGMFDHNVVEVINDAVKVNKFDLVEITNNFSITQLQHINCPKLMHIGLEHLEGLEVSFLDEVDGFILACSGDLAFWQSNPKHVDGLKILNTQTPVFLNMTFDLLDFDALMALLNPFGVCVEANTETKVGIVDFDYIGDILDKLEV